MFVGDDPVRQGHRYHALVMRGLAINAQKKLLALIEVIGGEVLYSLELRVISLLMPIELLDPHCR
jgi:hypothetical protein